MNTKDRGPMINGMNEAELREIVKAASDDALKLLADSLTHLHDITCWSCQLVAEEMAARRAQAQLNLKDMSIEIHVPDNGKVH